MEKTSWIRQLKITWHDDSVWGLECWDDSTRSIQVLLLSHWEVAWKLSGFSKAAATWPWLGGCYPYHLWRGAGNLRHRTHGWFVVQVGSYREALPQHFLLFFHGEYITLWWYIWATWQLHVNKMVPAIANGKLQLLGAWAGQVGWLQHATWHDISHFNGSVLSIKMGGCFWGTKTLNSWSS